MSLDLFQPGVTVQGSNVDISRLLKVPDVDGKGLEKIPKAKIKDALQQHRDKFGDYLIIVQPYEFTEENIEYIASYIKPATFVSTTSTPTPKEELPIQGMSFHIKYKSKVGQVMHMHYKGNSQGDFENHLQAHLKYHVANVFSECDKVFHMLITFTTEMQFEKAFEVLSKNRLRPGVYTDGFYVVEKRLIND